MYKICQTESSARRQRDLEEKFLEMMLKVSYDQITVSSFCNETGIPRKAFYRYFSGKEGILFSLIDHALMDFDLHSTVSDSDSSREPTRYMEAVFLYWVSNKRLLDGLQKNNLSGQLVQRAMTYTADLDTIPRFMQREDQRLREYGTMFMVCGLMSMIVQWHHDGFYKSTGEMAALAMELFTKPLFSGRVEDI